MADFKAILQAGEWTQFLNNWKTRTAQGHAVVATAYRIAGHKDIIDHFEKESGPDGRWTALKPATIARRMGKIPARSTASKRKTARATGKPFQGGIKILQDTGQMKGSILPTNVRRVTATSMLVFANSEYSAVHDEGSSKRNIPKREFMWLSNKAKDLMLDIITELLLK